MVFVCFGYWFIIIFYQNGFFFKPSFGVNAKETVPKLLVVKGCACICIEFYQSNFFFFGWMLIKQRLSLLLLMGVSAYAWNFICHNFFKKQIWFRIMWNWLQWVLYTLTKLLCVIKIFTLLSNYVFLGSHPNILYPILKKSDFGERSKVMREFVVTWLLGWHLYGMNRCA